MLYELRERPVLAEPVLVLALEGWIDAGFGAATARRALLNLVDTTEVATFDTDRLLDFRARRPTMHLVAGEVSAMKWPTIELRAGRDMAGTSLLFLTGAEPDHAWHAFCAAMVELVARFEVRSVIGLGAYPTAVPHTRPSRLAVSTSSPSLTDGRGYLRATIDVPAGVQTAVEKACSEAGVPAAGLWAQVPHYVATMPYPGAAATLVDGLAELADVKADASALHAEAVAMRERLDELVAANPEHVTMVRQLEEQYDAEADAGIDQGGLAGGRLPTADELAAEVERFLREQGGT
ncbi:MAG: proteasome assembly chaperone family protein [Acidimicrobiales bacterium]